MHEMKLTIEAANRDELVRLLVAVTDAVRDGDDEGRITSVTEAGPDDFATFTIRDDR